MIPTEKKLIGEIVKIDLLPEPPNHSLSLFGIVAYAIDSGIGIRFTDLQPEQQSELKRYVEFLREQHQADRKMCRI